MATISNPNDPNRNKSGTVNLTTPNATPASEQQAPASQAAMSGQYPTLQKYLGANQQAGQRLGEQVGKNITAQSQAAQKTAARETTEANTANTVYQGSLDQAKSFTERLKSPIAVQPANPVITQVEPVVAAEKTYNNDVVTPSAVGDVKKQPAIAMPKDTSGGMYDVSKYSTNVAGLDEARKIAADQEQLKQLRGLATGETFGERQDAGQKEVAEALNATAKEKAKSEELQKNITAESGRNALLSQLFGNQPGYKSGVRQLDQAFLQQDKSNQLGNISNQLKQNVGSINERAKQSQAAQTLLSDLVGQKEDVRLGLQTQTESLNDAYRADLQTRIAQVNQAKQLREQYLKDQFSSLQKDSKVSADAAAAFGLTPEVLQSLITDPKALNAYAGSTNDTSGVRLFNTIKDMSNINDILSTDRGYTLGQQANTLADVVNTNDIAALNNLAALAGRQNELTEASKFIGQQTGTSKLPELLQVRNQRFQDKDLSQSFQYDTGDQNEFVSTGPTMENPFRGGSGFPAGTSDGIPQGYNLHASAGASTNLSDYLYGPGIYRELQSGGNMQNTGAARPDQILNNQFDLAGRTEQQAVSNVQNQVNDYLNNIGYQNLLRILGDE